ncbi:retropepsin-like aspartic protease family protein [Leptothoe sp. PORK10 BA2]|uniref:retropepsin-like aspartic protease family protein n=1 Tax=Leptothoe sp. PORK10 BA2 TaxID=3110254 RepID=UPI002B210C77|nr:retropepsin-like aspartic protease [Leptothoe sp. PORK10 BA2]MEA5463355.1 retropepsin-like aspartic protease [Leptothoe sp. PORK10 BA2]
MLRKKQIRLIQILCLGTLAACQSVPVQTENVGEAAPLDSAPPKIAAATEAGIPDSKVSNTPGVAPTTPADATPDASKTAYQDALNLAASAVTLGQQATSPDDWDLIVGRWEQAMEKLKQVPVDHEHYATAQTKLKDYGRNLAQAQKQLAQLQRPTAEVPLSKPFVKTGAAPATATSNPPKAPTPRNTSISNASIPIVERRGGTPVVEVTINGSRYPMILDTGASHTHITRAMANELGIQVVGQVPVATASSRQTLVDVGYVDSIRVGNIARTRMPISIGDEVPIGLLGNDVYENFDVILQVNSVEFRPR